MPSQQKIILIAAGAGSGIAATFNAPLTGLAFALELMLVSVNVLNMSIVTLATVTELAVKH
jgi:CIC family chloride channel protein